MILKHMRSVAPGLAAKRISLHQSLLFFLRHMIATICLSQTLPLYLTDDMNSEATFAASHQESHVSGSALEHLMEMIIEQQILDQQELSLTLF